MLFQSCRFFSGSQHFGPSNICRMKLKLRSASCFLFYEYSVDEHQYSETNVMHFLLNLLRIKGLYMFRALLAHPQGVLHKRHLANCVGVMSVGCTRWDSN
jgi:hypothetical protein